MGSAGQGRMTAPEVGNLGNVVGAALVAVIGLAYAHLNVAVIVPALAKAFESDDVASIVSPSLIAWEIGWILALVMGWLLSRYLPFVSAKARYELARRVIEKYDVNGDDVRLAVVTSSLRLPRRRPRGVGAEQIGRRWVLAYRYDTRLDWLTCDKPRLLIFVVGRKREVFVWKKGPKDSYVEAPPSKLRPEGALGATAPQARVVLPTGATPPSGISPKPATPPTSTAPKE